MEYFCTCGRGTEVFAVKELEYIFPGSQVTHRDGKVFVSLDEDGFLKQLNSPDLLCSLRTVERLFVTILHTKDFDVSFPKQVAGRLKSAVSNIDSGHWEACFQAWTAIQCGVSSCGKHENRKSSEASNPVTFDVSHASPENQNCTVDSDISPIKHSVTHSGDRELSTTSRQSGVKRSSDDIVTFRVSAKCSGQAAYAFTSQKLSRFLGPLIAQSTGWRVDLRKPDVEVYVQLNHEGLLVGMSASRIPLSCRPYLKHPGLRTTVASIMASLASLQQGMTLLDPMCGEATILIEAAKQCPGAFYIGCDISVDQCLAAVDNIMHADEAHSVHVIRADVTCLPFSDNSISAVVCDVPFGCKHGTFEEVCALLPKLVVSVNRVLKAGGRVVLLIGADFKKLLVNCVEALQLSVDTKETFNSQTSVIESVRRTESVSETVSDNTAREPCAAAICEMSDGTAPELCSNFKSCLKDEEARFDVESTRQWTTDLMHYVKLGDTHAFICCFQKNY